MDDQFQRDLDYLGLYLKFPWHRLQLAALNAATDVVVIRGGTRSGKSQAALGIVSRLVRREGPIYRRLRKPENRPLKIWVAPLTFEKYQSVWEPRLIADVFTGIKHEHVSHPHNVFTWDDACAKGNTLWGKTSDQGYMSFESDEVDLIIFDEEPDDQKVYTAGVQRFATTNGVCVFAFTPLKGMTWTAPAFHDPVAKVENQVAERVWVKGTVTLVQMGMADNPAAVEGGGVQRLLNDPGVSEAERKTRLYGDYGFSEGLIWPECSDLSPRTESPYLLNALPAGRPYNWVLTTDPNKRHGGLLTAIDPDGNWIVVAEHYAENIPDSLHARGYLQILRAFGLTTPQNTAKPEVGVYADPGGAGAMAIINMGETGLYAQPVPKDAGSVSASIKSIRRRLWIDPAHKHPVTGVQGAPRLYFLRGLQSTWKAEGVEYRDSRLMWELRQYRQKPAAAADTPIKEKDDVVDPLRYLAIVRPTEAFVAPKPVNEERKKLDTLSQRANEDFDDLAKRVVAGKTRDVVRDVW